MIELPKPTTKQEALFQGFVLLFQSGQFPQLAKLSNRSNYKFTEGEAEKIVELYEALLADATEKWLNHDSFNLKKLETFDQTELD